MKVQQTHTVPQNTKPDFLNRYAPKVFAIITSKERAKKQIDKGFLKVNGQKVSKAYRITPGDVIELYEDQRTSKKVFEEELEVVYEDDYLAVINKPGGLPVNGNTFKTLENALPHNLKPTTQEDALPCPLPVHRLDVPTCGLVMVAKTVNAQVILGDMLQQKKVDKQYHAVVIGEISPAEGLIDEPIQEKPSKTKYKVLEVKPSVKYGKLSKVALYPITGRTHQLRIHMANKGNSIVGDDYYSGKHELQKGKGLLLCAVEVKLQHPITKEPLKVTIDPPRKFGKYMEREAFRAD